VDDERSNEMNALRERVAQLENKVAELVRALTANGTIAARDIRAQRRVSPEEIDAAFTTDPSTAPAQGHSPYRGHGPDILLCTVCAKPLDPEDPELVARSGGRVCTTCFQRP
jgi:hypothetical protein